MMRLLPVFIMLLVFLAGINSACSGIGLAIQYPYTNGELPAQIIDIAGIWQDRKICEGYRDEISQNYYPVVAYDTYANDLKGKNISYSIEDLPQNMYDSETFSYSGMIQVDALYSVEPVTYYDTINSAIAATLNTFGSSIIDILEAVGTFFNLDIQFITDLMAGEKTPIITNASYNLKYSTPIFIYSPDSESDSSYIIASITNTLGTTITPGKTIIVGDGGVEE